MKYVKVSAWVQDIWLHNFVCEQQARNQEGGGGRGGEGGGGPFHPQRVKVPTLRGSRSAYGSTVQVPSGSVHGNFYHP